MDKKRCVSKKCVQNSRDTTKKLRFLSRSFFAGMPPELAAAAGKLRHVGLHPLLVQRVQEEQHHRQQGIIPGTLLKRKGMPVSGCPRCGEAKLIFSCRSDRIPA